MDTIQRPGWIFICLVLFVTGAMVVTTGCTGSAAGQQGPTNPVHEKQSENPAVTTTTAMRTPEAPSQKNALPSPAPVSSPGAIVFDPVGEPKAGESVTITGTTSLPADTNLFWQISKDQGNPPTGIDMNVQAGIMANNQVMKGSGSSNRVSLTVEAKDTKDLGQGKYVIVVVSLKGDPMTTDPSTGTLAGYTYVTLK